MKGFKNFHSFESFLSSLGMFRMKPGLERMNKCLEMLDLSSLNVTVVQIVGTNGKGSTACFLESLARHNSLKTGLYTSPHLVSVKERILVNRVLLHEEVWVEAANVVYHNCGHCNLSYFEFLTIMAVFIFEQEQVDLAIMEAGLGGHHDATSAVNPALNVFTQVGLDHTHILGKTVEEISKDKSMAMRGGSAVLARQDKASMDIFKARGKEVGAELFSVPDFFDFSSDSLKFRLLPEMTFSEDDLGLKGNYQKDNAATALLAWYILAETQDYESDIDDCAAGLKNAFWPGRMHIAQRLPMVILDGAHNVSSMKALKYALEMMEVRPATVIFSCMKDKDVMGLTEVVTSFGADNILVQDIRDNPRAMPGKELAAMLGACASVLDDTEKYLTGLTAHQSPVLICGSLYLLGYIYALFPEWLER